MEKGCFGSGVTTSDRAKGKSTYSGVSMFPSDLWEAVEPFCQTTTVYTTGSSKTSNTMLEVGSSSGSKILSLPEAGTVVPPYEHPHHLLGLSAPLVPPGVSLEGYSKWLSDAIHEMSGRAASCSSSLGYLISTPNNESAGEVNSILSPAPEPAARTRVTASIAAPPTTLVEQELQIGGENVSKFILELLLRNSKRPKDISIYTKPSFP